MAPQTCWTGVQIFRHTCIYKYNCIVCHCNMLNHNHLRRDWDTSGLELSPNSNSETLLGWDGIFSVCRKPVRYRHDMQVTKYCQHDNQDALSPIYHTDEPCILFQSIHLHSVWYLRELILFFKIFFIFNLEIKWRNFQHEGEENLWLLENSHCRVIPHLM